MPPRKHKGKAKSAKARQRQQQRQQRQEHPADAPKTTHKLREELTELGGDPSLLAKRKVLERAVDLARVQFDESTGRSASACRHGFTPPLSRDVIQLIQAFIEIFKGAGKTCNLAIDISSLITTKYSRVWEDRFSRESIKAYAVSRGTDLLQAAEHDSFNATGQGNCSFYATIILFAENYETHWDKHREDCVVMTIARKIGDLLKGGLRAATKFFLQRVHCSCLDNVYAKVKSRQSMLCRPPDEVPRSIHRV